MKTVTQLDEAARRQAAEEKALKAVSGTRVRLVMAHDPRSVFFATLALRLKVECSWDVTPTMATDGTYLIVNPDFCLGLTEEERLGVVLHEVLHAALAHQSRRGHRDPQLWNVACDLRVNFDLKEAGYRLPAGGLFPGEGEFAHLPTGLSAEEYYARLQEETPPGKGRGEGDGPDPGGCGQVLDAGSLGSDKDGQPSTPDQAAARQSEADWQTAVAQAAQLARQRGDMPAGLRRFVGEILQPRVDWRHVLREFVSRSARNDYCWHRPARRWLTQGLYLPGLYSEELGEVVCLVDTSGSIGDRQLRVFAGEMQGILESFPGASLTILYHDVEVAGVQRWSPADGPLVPEPRGGGGTSHVPAFDWLAAGNAPEAACVVALSDCYTQYPDYVPELPVLWAVVGNPNAQPPFGQVVEVKD